MYSYISRLPYVCIWDTYVFICITTPICMYMGYICIHMYHDSHMYVYGIHIYSYISPLPYVCIWDTYVFICITTPICMYMGYICIHIYHHSHMYVYGIHMYSYISRLPYVSRLLIHVHMYIYITTPIYVSRLPQLSPPPAPMNHVKLFKGWPLRDAPTGLVQLWYKTCPPGHDGRVEMKNPTRLSNKTSTA